MEPFRPRIVKKPTKRRSKVKQPEINYQFVLPPEDVQDLYIGGFILGRLSKELPNLDSFETLAEHTHVIIQSTDKTDMLIISKEDDIMWGIDLLIDSPFITVLFQSKKFYFNLEKLSNDDEIEEVFMKIYFRSLPVENLNAKHAKVVTQLFKKLFDVGFNAVKNRKKNLDNFETMENAFTAIRERQLGEQPLLPSSSKEYQQPKDLRPALRPYQQNAVQWMLQKEKLAYETPAEAKAKMHPNYVEVKLPCKTVYFDQHAGNVLLEQPLTEFSLNGAILADEMGLGKTIEVLALILSDSNPIDDENSDGASVSKEDIVNESENVNEDEEEVKYDVEGEDADDFVKETQVVSIHRQRKRPSYAVEVLRDDKINPYEGSQVEELNARERLNLIYNETLTSVWDKVAAKKPEVACICGSFEEKNLKMCVDCKKKQHYKCVGYDPKTCGEFRCSQCWPKQASIRSNGTLIVCPTSLCQQWINEISRHVGRRLSVLRYEGSNVLTPIYPTRFAAFDIVITTYAVLQSEFYLIDQCAGKSLRNARKYSSPGSPITLVHWKRLCLDEAQAIENTGSMIASMASRLRADFRWAITGTPVSISLADLHGLVEYLHLAPYDDENVFGHTLYAPYLYGKEDAFVDFFARVMWRTCKSSVLEQINIPPQTVRCHVVEFTQVERYFYDSETKECRRLFMSKATEYDNDRQLMSLVGGELKALIQPVSSLRRVCIHHNVVNGRYLLTKKSMNSMQELLDALIARNINDCDDHLRMVIASFNGLAGVYLLLRNPLTAAEYYHKVMALEEKYFKGLKNNPSESSGEILTIDLLPLIHTYYNLRRLVEADDNLIANLGNLLGKELTLSAPALKTRQEFLENEYVRKYEMPTKQAIQALNEITEKFAVLEANVSRTNWYVDLVAAIFDNKLKAQFRARVDRFLQNFQNTKFRTSQSFVVEYLMTWCNALCALQEDAIDNLNSLYEIADGERIAFTEKIVKETVDCHLRPDKNAKGKLECRFCKVNKVLIEYEKVLYTPSKQQTWMPSEQEMVLTAAVKLGEHKLKGEEFDEMLADGATFLEMLEVQKKEFKELRKAWTYLEAQLCANDELVLCKTRLQLKAEDPHKPRASVQMSLKQLSYEINNHLETINEIAEHEIDVFRFNLEAEHRNHTAKLEKCLGTYKYLKSLQGRDNQNLDPCPICRCPLEGSWNMMQCGHAYCLTCMETIVGRNNISGDQKITCAVCRQVQKLSDINCVNDAVSASKEAEAADGELAVTGNCSSKVKAIVKLILELKRDEPDVKVLVFTCFQPVLRILRDIFEQNGVKSLILTSGKQVVKTVEGFRDKQKGITALILPVSLGGKGLNLIEATHVIFVGPMLDPAEEKQAIGRVHRIGQTKKTVVHKFIMKDSVEASIHRAMNSKDKAKWDRSRITVGHLKELLLEEDPGELHEVQLSQDGTV